MRRILFACVYGCAALCACEGRTAAAQEASSASASVNATDKLVWTTDALVPERFLAVHGRRALVMGYPKQGLEVWAYPLQLVSNYKISFIPRPGTFSLHGEDLLRRVEYLPDEVIRTYVGPDFVVRERIFVPLNETGAIITYEAQGKSVDLSVQFQPVLNLMWPAALGGQDTAWDSGAHAYVIREPLHGNSAVIGSPQTIEHDVMVNRTVQPTTRRTLIIRPVLDAKRRMIARVYVGFDPKGGTPASGVLARLQASEEQLRAEQKAHYSDLLRDALQIRTPDEDVNRALAWSVIALDQAWVCNPLLGCGEVAGYGPSRGERRPQYAWFFAGDGLVATDALVAAGEFGRAREELAFIAKYQDKKTGMIWHEISQGVDIESWKRSYPYMFVHVDITFDYLRSFENYVKASGDEPFLKDQWPGVQAAYKYCASVLDPSTGLPQIPAGREGANEQDKMRDDIGLSSSWISAAEAYAAMARRMGDTQAAAAATQAAGAARKSIAALDWDPVHHYWLQGHSGSGAAIDSQRSRPTALLRQGVFTAEQNREAMDALAAPAFQTDWGVRSMSADSAEFDPDSYSKGSVSALGTSSIALAFWNQHRSVTAQQIWDGLLPWNMLDSPGHMHEVAAGNVFHPEVESVPEQTWSSAGFYSAAVHGLLGLQADASAHRITFTPHLPPEWDQLEINNVRVGESILKLRLTRSPGFIELAVENSGPAVLIDFGSEIPLGAVQVNASSGLARKNKAARMHVSLEHEAQDEDAVVAFAAEKGSSHCAVRFRGGVQVSVPRSSLATGDSSKGLRITDVSIDGKTLHLTGYLKQGGEAAFDVRSQWKLTGAAGAEIESRKVNTYRMVMQTPVPAKPGQQSGYVKVSAQLHFAER